MPHFSRCAQGAVYYTHTFTGSFTPGYSQNTSTGQASTPTATPTPIIQTPQAPISGWVGKSYTYTQAHPHAVTAAGGDTYTYDANGNMTCRVEGGQVFVQAYNAENRLSGVTLVSGTCASPGNTQQAWTFTYDGDGTRVSQVYFDGTNTQTTLYFFGGLYETTVETSAVKKYYAIAGQTVAMNDGSGMKYLLTDHLGSVVAITNANGSVLSQTRYLPFGQVRTDQFAPGTITQTDFAFTGQRNVASLKLMDYHARMYDAYLNRWTQPDTIVPNAANPQSLDRYSYVLNNPLRYGDPSGHDYCDKLNKNNEEDCTSGEQRFASKTRRDIPSWDQAFIKNVRLRDISQAELAFISFSSNPLEFAEYYVNPRNAPLEYDALELFTGYSTLHTTADQLIWNTVAQTYGMPAAEALSNAKLHNLEAGLGAQNYGNGSLTAAGVIGAAITGGSGGSPADAWYKASFGSAEESLTYHYDLHGGPWSSSEEYTQAAKDFYAANADLAEPWPINQGREMGVKITTNGYYGIYTVDGQIVSFGHK